MPYPPPFPLPPPSVLPPVDPSLHSLEVAGLDWFFTAEQEASSEQLRFKVGVRRWCDECRAAAVPS
jgi:hypothetical protein